MFQALRTTGRAEPETTSVQHDFIVCLEDGKKFKTLNRHLRSWGLPRDYPMVASAYAAQRSGSPRRSVSAGSLLLPQRLNLLPPRRPRQGAWRAAGSLAE